MRAAMALAVLLGGCVWTEFDQLKDDVWVDSVDGVGGSAKYGEALVEVVEAAPVAAGTSIGVLGRNGISVTGLQYDAEGGRTTPRVDLPSRVPLVFQFDEFPVVAGDPSSEQWAFAALTGSATDQNRGLKVGLLEGNFVDGSAYEATNAPTLHANNAPPTAMTFGPPSQAVIGRRGQLLHVTFGNVPGTWVGCALPSDETAYALAYGDVTADGVAEYVVASAPVGIDGAPDPGRIWIFPEVAIGTFDATGAVGCPPPTGELPSPTNGASFPFGPGTAMVVGSIDGTPAGMRVIVSSPGTAGRVAIVDFTASVTPPAFTQLSDASVGDVGPVALADVAAANPGPELVVGAPGADDAGPTRAGAVRILRLDGTPAVADHILHDADPATEQHFGKSLVVVPWGPTERVLVVGAEGEVFTYFRTSFYDDVRVGR
jgi:hypothetical protein